MGPARAGPRPCPSGPTASVSGPGACRRAASPSSSTTPLGWLRRAGRPLSLSLPLASGGLKGAVVDSYFDNLLPDSRAIRERLATRFGTASTQAFELLRAVGRDCVGAIQLLAEDEAPADLEQISGTPMSVDEVEALLLQTVTPGRLGGLLEEEDALRISLAGAQEKTALLWHEQQWMRPHGATPTTHILKLPLGLVGDRQADFSTSVENEWLCLNILQAYGLAVPRCESPQLRHAEGAGRRALRPAAPFDGTVADALAAGRLLPGAGLPPHLKYEADGGPGVLDLARILQQSVNAREDLRTLFAAQLIFWMLAAPDGHAKNFSIHLLPEGRFRLAPLYDVMSIWPVEGGGPNQFSPHDAKLAMAVMGKNRHYRRSTIQRRHFNATAQQCLGASAEPLIADVLAKTPHVVRQMYEAPPPGFPERVAERVLAGLTDAAKRLEAMPP